METLLLIVLNFYKPHLGNLLETFSKMTWNIQELKFLDCSQLCSLNLSGAGFFQYPVLYFWLLWNINDILFWEVPFIIDLSSSPCDKLWQMLETWNWSNLCITSCIAKFFQMHLLHKTFYIKNNSCVALYGHLCQHLHHHPHLQLICHVSLRLAHSNPFW